jgi:hypothetical protein
VCQTCTAHLSIRDTQIAKQGEIMDLLEGMKKLGNEDNEKDKVLEASNKKMRVRHVAL